jgi:hypothetical protein
MPGALQLQALKLNNATNGCTTAICCILRVAACAK